MDVNGLDVFPVGERTAAFSHNRYDIAGLNTASNNFRFDQLPATVLSILFQDGNPATKGRNGLTIEALLEVVKHRLESFQEGPFACVENQDVIILLDGALKTLYGRGQRLNQPNKQG